MCVGIVSLINGFDRMLANILEFVGVDAAECGELLGISPRVFGEWASGQSPIPESVLPRLATIVGVRPSDLRMTAKQARQQGDIVPAIWFKLRGSVLSEIDREYVLLIRQLGYYLDELEEVTQRRAQAWQLLFETTRRATDPQFPPREQGRIAARAF